MLTVALASAFLDVDAALQIPGKALKCPMAHACSPDPSLTYFTSSYNNKFACCPMEVNWHLFGAARGVVSNSVWIVQLSFPSYLSQDLRIIDVFSLHESHDSLQRQYLY